MRYPGHPDGLRITVGTDAEIDRLLGELADVSLSTARPRPSALTATRRRPWDRSTTSRVPAVAATAEIVRKTGRPTSASRLDLDGTGRSEVATGVGFLDHMLELFARHR